MKGCFWLAYYYWNPSGQQQQPMTTYPQFQFPTQTQQQMTPPAISGSSLVPAAPSFLRGEESYIENILRLNRGKEGVFYFTVPEAQRGERGNTIEVRGAVVEAGRDHAIIHEFKTDHYFLFPMIYFDFARYEEPITYINRGSNMNQPGR
jgi:spore germination protein Q